MRRRYMAFAAVVAAAALATGVAATGPVLPNDGVFWGCYDASGAVRLIDDGITTKCPKGWIGPVSWSQAGPTGAQGEPGTPGADGISPTVLDIGPGEACAEGGVSITAGDQVTYVCDGTPGATGDPGPKGDLGDPLANIDNLDGIACGSGDATGVVDVAYGTDGALSLRCAPTEVRVTVTIASSHVAGVTSSPAGIDCPGTCSAMFPAGTTVVLASTVDAHYASTWTGVACATALTCALGPVAAAKNVLVGTVLLPGYCEGTAPTYWNGTAGCVGGQWVLVSCASGFSNCDGSTFNGCECNTNSDPRNCGRCGAQCPVGTVCSGGTCAAAP